MATNKLFQLPQSDEIVHERCIPDGLRSTSLEATGDFDLNDVCSECGGPLVVVADSVEEVDEVNPEDEAQAL